MKKIGTKMRVEKELGYEPSLLVEMEKVIEDDRPGSGWTHRAWVEKDRFDILNFKHFDNPKFEDFLPHISLLNIGGDHRALDVDRDSQEMFKNNKTGADYYKKREQTLEKIKNEINLLLPGRDEKTKTDRINLTKDIFGTHSWSEICEMQLDDLLNGLTAIEKKNIKRAEKLSKSDRVESKETKKEKK